MNHTFDQMMKAMGFTRVETESAEERAAILEFDAGYKRLDAERLAMEELETRRKIIDIEKVTNK